MVSEVRMTYESLYVNVARQLFCEPGRTRTFNRYLKRVLLCQLSYRPASVILAKNSDYFIP